MTAQALLKNDLLPLTLAHTGKEAFYWMNDCHVQHLPVVHEKKLVAVLSEEDLFNYSLFDSLATHDFSLMTPVFVRPDDHVFDIIRVMGDHRLSTVPVVDENGNYLGLVSQGDVLRFFTNCASFSEPGGIITLEIAPRDFEMSAVCRLVEEEEARVLSAFVTSSLQSDTVEVTLKINRTDISRVVASLVRHEYYIKQTYGFDQAKEGYRERYDSLMHYLNI